MINARGDAPAFLVSIEPREQSWIGGYRRDLSLTRLQIDLLETEKASAPIAGSRCQIQLGNIGTSARAGISHREAGGNRFATGDLQIAI